MRIGLDWDGTFTADPALWRGFVTMAKLSGHDVRIVTARHPSDGRDVDDEASRLGVHVSYCGGRQKQDCWGADIWIDDRVETVLSAENVKKLKDLDKEGWL